MVTDILVADRRGNEVRRIPSDPRIARLAAELHKTVCGSLWSGVVVHRFLIADRYGRKVGTVPPAVFGGFEQMIRTGVEA